MCCPSCSLYDECEDIEICCDRCGNFEDGSCVLVMESFIAMGDEWQENR
jgi:hypothetical protein